MIETALAKAREGSTGRQVPLQSWVCHGRLWSPRFSLIDKKRFKTVRSSSDG